jgi:hypothetical protein
MITYVGRRKLLIDGFVSDGISSTPITKRNGGDA